MATTGTVVLTGVESWETPKRHAIERSLRLAIARAAASTGDILTWAAHVFPDKFPLPFCLPLHQYLVDIRHDRYTSTEAPRDSSKTTIKGFAIPIFQSIYEPELYNHYLQVQSTDTKANAVNRTIQLEFEENEDLRELVGDMVGPRWTVEQFVLKNGVCFTAVGAGQSIRGINYRNHRPDYIMPDDLYDEDHIYNPDATLKINRWFWSTLYPARAKGKKHSIQLTGTAINKDDLMEHLKKLDNWQCRTFKSILDWENKVVLWPAKASFEELMQDMKGMSTVTFMREMQNERQDDATSLVKLAWLKKYDPGTLRPDGRFEYVGCVLGCDPSIGDKAENDYTGIVLMYVYRYTDSKGYFYYLDKIWKEHLSLDARVNLLQSIQDQQPEGRKITCAYIEGIAGFKDFVAEVKRRTTLPVREIDKVKDKLANLESKAWFFETGHVFYNQNIEPSLLDDWKTQMTTNHPRYDDLRDATLLPLELIKADAMAYAD